MLVPAARRRGAARRFETEGREEPDQLRKAGRADQKPQAGERGAQAKSVKVDGSLEISDSEGDTIHSLVGRG